MRTYVINNNNNNIFVLSLISYPYQIDYFITLLACLLRIIIIIIIIIYERTKVSIFFHACIIIRNFIYYYGQLTRVNICLHVPRAISYYLRTSQILCHPSPWRARC